MPEGTCIRVAVDGSTVYYTEDLRGSDADGKWIGVPESVLAEAFPGADLNEDDRENIVWINQQRASISSIKQGAQSQSADEK